MRYNQSYDFLTNPTIRYRVARHTIMWSATIFLVYARFEYNAIQLSSPAGQKTYIWFSTLVFGGLILLNYILITVLLREFVLRRSQVKVFVVGLAGVHVLTALLVRLHISWFVDFFTLPRLPVAYTTFAEHVLGLPLWQAAFDPVVVGVFCFSQVYSYLLLVLTPKMFKDLFLSQIKKTGLEKDNLQLEYQFLKAQVNPHFLFNTLNSLYGLSMYAPAQTPAAITKLSDLMRYTLYGTETELVPLEREISFLRNYVDLQRLRHEAKADVTFEVSGSPDGLSIAPLLLLVFVENAFKHGAQASLAPPMIQIDLTVAEKNLALNVVNNAPDCDKPKADSNGGIGHKNARRRLDLFYPGRHELTTYCQDGKYTVNLKIDLHETALPSNRRR